MKILHVINSLAVGGAEILLRDTVKLLPQTQHVICYLEKPDELREDFASATVHFLEYNSKWDLLQTIFRLKKIIKNEKVDVVHTHLFLSTIIGRAACWKSEVKLVSTIHSQLGIELFKKSKLSLWIERLTVSKKHSMVTVSDVVLTDYKKHIPFKGRTFVLHNFVKPCFFKLTTKASKSEFRTLKIVSVGNLKPVKNHIFLLQAVETLKGQPVEIDIYGEGSERVSLQARIDQYQLPVQLMGFVSNVEEVLIQYHCFVTCSQHEGFGIAAMEAMAAGMPVLAPDLPVFREILGNGALYFNLNAPEDLAGQIKKILSSEVDIKQLAERGRERALKIATQDKYIGRLNEVYAQVLGKSI